jgi:hypothetical protein
MTTYEYFYRDQLSLDEPWDKEWDIFASAWDKSERVSRNYGLAVAKRKIWLVHPEYQFSGHRSPRW